MYFRLKSTLTNQEVKNFRNNLIKTFQTPRFISVNSSLVNISLTLVSTGVAVDVFLNSENVTTFLNSSIRQVSVLLNGVVYTASPTSFSSATTPSSNGLDSHNVFIIVGSVVGAICLIAIVAFVLLKKSRTIADFQPTYQVLTIDASFSKLWAQVSLSSTLSSDPSTFANLHFAIVSVGHAPNSLFH